MKTLLLGDSILRYFSSTLPGEIVNKSRVGCFSFMVERDVPTYNIQDFDKIFLLIGINDFLNRGYTAQKTSECIIHAIQAIQSLNPRELNVLGLLPVLGEFLEESDYCNKNIPLINNAVRTFCEESSINYIDTYVRFCNSDGRIDKELFRDGIHPSEKGYVVLSDLLKEQYLFSSNSNMTDDNIL